MISCVDRYWYSAKRRTTTCVVKHRVYVPGTGPDHKTVELVGEQVPQCVGRAILSFAVLSLWLKQWVVVGVRIIVGEKYLKRSGIDAT